MFNTVSYIVKPSYNGNGSITLTINSTGTNSFLWSDGVTTQNRANLVAGNYSVVITNADPAITTKSLQFIVAQETTLIDRSNIEDIIAKIQCCLGHKGYSRTREIEKGCAIGPCDNLSYLIRLYEVVKNWYPAGYEIQKAIGPYYAFDTIGITFPLFYSIIAPDGRGGSIVLFNTTATSAAMIVTFINAGTATTGFSAKLIGTNLWINAPVGYEGVKLTGNFVAIQEFAGRVYTIYGFQGQQEGIIANTPCIDNAQIERALEMFKSACSICAPAQTFGEVNPLPA